MLLGVGCGIMAVLCGIAAINAVIAAILAVVSGNVFGLIVLIYAAILLAMARFYGQGASVIYAGQADDYNFERCAFLSLLLGGVGAFGEYRKVSTVLAGRPMSSWAVFEAVVGVALVSLLLGIGVLSLVETGVLSFGRRR